VTRLEAKYHQHEKTLFWLFSGIQERNEWKRIKTSAESSRIHQPENQTSSSCSFRVLIGRQGSTEGEAALR